MSDIFISYASVDRLEAEKLAQALESLGFSVWWDRSIPVGKSYEKVIEAALDKAKCVLVIWSNDSVKSDWVRAEVAEAQRQGKLFPLNLDGSNPPLVYRALQTADFSSWSGEASDAVFKQLTADIRSHIETPVAKEEITHDKNEPNHTVPSKKKQTKRKWIAPVSVVLLLSLLIAAVVTIPGKITDQEENIGIQIPTKDKRDNKNTQIKIDPGPRVIEAVEAPMAEVETGIAPEMVAIPKGCLQMGSPESEQGRENDERQHEVCLDAFKIGKFEVSFEEYQQFCDATGCKKPDDQGWGRGNRPVLNVNWDDATAYAEWLSNKTGRRYRLPTEAEWEYAARGGRETRYPWGDDIGSNKANCAGCGSQWDKRKTAPIGSFQANDFGLYDTVGNVWEWTCSRYVGKYNGSEQSCAEQGDNGRRVFRGGSWSYVPKAARSASREWNHTFHASRYLGFRLRRMD